MARRHQAIGALTALAFLVLALPGSAGDARRAGPSGRDGRASAEAKGAYALGEVKIVGSSERPAILFFLPRSGFRLLPYRADPAWKERVIADDRSAYGE